MPVEQHELGSDPGIHDLLERREADAGHPGKKQNETQDPEATDPDRKVPPGKGAKLETLRKTAT
jgi:hypothetical protein